MEYSTLNYLELNILVIWQSVVDGRSSITGGKWNCATSHLNRETVGIGHDKSHASASAHLPVTSFI